MLIEAGSGRRILHSPFTDEGQFQTARWSVSVTVQQGEKSFTDGYTSRAAYPGAQQWQTFIYDRDQSALPPHQVISANGTLPRQTVTQERAKMFNIYQGFGAVLLEKERQRITDGEPLEACVSTHLSSQVEQEAILCIHCIGEHTAYLEDIQLTPIEPIQHENIQPLFMSWMPSKPTYYAITLRAGENDLSVFTQPDVKAGWWGVGAVVFDYAGKVIPGGSL
jgi:hypothetical protein